MAASFVVSLGFFVAAKLGHAAGTVDSLLATIGVTTVVWIAVTFLTPPVEERVLAAFYAKVRPAGPGWARVRRESGLRRVARLAAARAARLGARPGVGLRRALRDGRLRLRAPGPGGALERRGRAGDRSGCSSSGAASGVRRQARRPRKAKAPAAPMNWKNLKAPFKALVIVAICAVSIWAVLPDPEDDPSRSRPAGRSAPLAAALSDGGGADDHAASAGADARGHRPPHQRLGRRRTVDQQRRQRSHPGRASGGQESRPSGAGAQTGRGARVQDRAVRRDAEGRCRRAVL